MAFERFLSVDVSAEGETYAVLDVQADGLVIVADAALLFNADFERSGPDLLLVNDGAPTLVVPGYFAAASPADLITANGATLSGATVTRLAGPIAPGQYAQAAPAPLTASPIGQVETLTGGATVQRADGVIETLVVGTKIFLDDVVETGDGAVVSLTFVDGTIFTMAAASRMIIDDLIYDADATDNSATFNLIEGSFVFIAGQVARTGGMEVTTPAATMGIRGTTVLVDMSTIGGITTTEVSLTRDPDGSVGRVELFDLDGNLIAEITTTDTIWRISPVPGQTQEIARTAFDDATDSVLIAEAVAAYQSAIDRVAQGGTFVQLQGPPLSSPAPAMDASPGTDLDVDGLDEQQDLAPPAPPPPPTGGSGPPADAPFDEGGLRIFDGTAPNVLVAGSEDARGAFAITGAIEIAGLPGRAPLFNLVTRPANGSVTLNADGTFAYAPDPDFNGLDSFIYAIVGGNGVIGEGTVTVDVAAVNDAPTTASVSVTGIEDGIVTGAVPGSDVDGDALVFSLIGAPSNGSAAVLEDGTFSYTPAPDFFGTDSFVVCVSDNAGGTAQATVTVDVLGVNDPPRGPGAVAVSLAEGGETTVLTGVLDRDDPDGGPAPVWTSSSVAVFGSFSLAADGSWSYALDPDAVKTLNTGDTRVEVFNASLTDSFGATDGAVITVTINGTNDAPEARTVFAKGTMGGQLSGIIEASDIDNAAADLSYSVIGTGPANGNLSLQPDGSYTYTPVAGFRGIDSFDYAVTDPGGATSTSTVVLQVNGSQAVSDDGVMLTLDFDSEGSGGNPVGSLVIGSDAVDGNLINLVVAMDASGSIGAANWNNQINSVADALVELAGQFQGSQTSVQVRVISYATNSVIYGDFDLQNANLIQTVRSLPFLRGQTNWENPLVDAESFFDASPDNADNFIFFISDGRPTDDDFGAVVTRLGQKDYSVSIEAFGIGSRVSLDGLAELDPTPTPLDSVLDLTGALTATPLFNPELASLSLTLRSDGVDHGDIGGAELARVGDDGLSFLVALADAEGVADLLGETNLFTARAVFDIDGPAGDATIELFASEVIRRADDSQTLIGTDRNDILLGSNQGDAIVGGAGDDVVLGYNGDDVLGGGAGFDSLLGGAGDDRLVIESYEPFQPGKTERVDGGEGRDVLALSGGGDINSDLLPVLDARSIEVLDLENGAADVLALSPDVVAGLFLSNDTELEQLLNGAYGGASATILGEAGDRVTLEVPDGVSLTNAGEADVTDASGATLEIYQFSQGGNVLATLGIDTDIEVVTHSVAG